MPKRIFYADIGTLKGTTPTGKVVTICHRQRGQSGFEMKLGSWETAWAYAGMVEEELGIPVKTKKSGGQQGYPQEAVLRAVWRYFVNLYNDYTPGVELL